MKPGLAAFLSLVGMFLLTCFVALLGTTSRDGIGVTWFLVVILSFAILIVPFVVYRKQYQFRISEISKNQETHMRSQGISDSAKIIHIEDSKSYRVTTISLDVDSRTIYSYDGTEEKTIPIDSLMQCDVVESGCVIQSEKASNVMLGASIAGGAGAVMGSLFSTSGGDFVSEIYIRFITNDLREPVITLNLLTRNVDRQFGHSDRIKRATNEVYAFAIIGIRQQGKS